MQVASLVLMNYAVWSSSVLAETTQTSAFNQTASHTNLTTDLPSGHNHIFNIKGTLSSKIKFQDEINNKTICGVIKTGLVSYYGNCVPCEISSVTNSTGLSQGLSDIQYSVYVAGWFKTFPLQKSDFRLAMQNSEMMTILESYNLTDYRDYVVDFDSSLINGGVDLILGQPICVSNSLRLVEFCWFGFGLLFFVK